MKVRALFVLAAAAAVLVASCSFIGQEVVTGSGTAATRSFDVKDFTGVSVHGPFQVEIKRGDKFLVSITADDNLLDLVRATRDGSLLTVGIGDGNKSIHAKTPLKAAITMPELDDVRLTGACKGTVEGFKKGKSFKVEVNGASTLDGEVEADKLSVDANGASTVALHGNADEAALEANGASTLKLAELTLGRADVRLNGASTGTVRVHGKLDYDVNGASRLTYDGNPTLGKREAHGASSAGPK
jgi:hypothetical protein